MNRLIDPLHEIDDYNRLLEQVKNNKNVTLTGPSDSQKAHISYAILEHTGKKAIFISYNEMQARKMYDDFLLFAKDNVAFLPAKEIVLHDIEAKSSDAVFERINALDRISSGDYKILVTSPEALVHKLVSPKIFLISNRIGRA